MKLAVLVVKEDLQSIDSDCGSIEINDDVYHFKDVAKELNLILFYTIDESDVTIINQAQQVVLKDQINTISQRTDVNQTIVNILSTAQKAAGFYDCLYIKLVGVK
ncbi:MAG TPA: hypothetical protein VFF04_06965 [Candidatus Babeliales bacterium]|nr:hypothetical protein [Candidatus Babeliales bacterium]